MHELNPPSTGQGLPSVREDGITLLDMALVVVENIRWLILLPLLVGSIAFGASFLLTPVFTAKAVILPPQQQQGGASNALQSLGVLAGLAGGASGLKNPADQYVALMQSNTVSDRIIDEHKLVKIYDAVIRQDARDTLALNVRITAGKRDGLITIEVDDVVPKRSAAMANGYIAELQRLTTQLALTESQQRRLFFEHQLQQTRDRLAYAQKSLQASGINEGALRAEPKAAAEAYAALKAQVTAAEVRVRAMQGYTTSAAPEYKQAQASLSALRGQLSAVEKTDSQAATGEYIDKYREFKYQESLFELFAKQFEMAKMDESREGAIIQVVDLAAPPERKSKPRRAFIAVSSAAVTALACLLFVILRAIAGRIVLDEVTAQKLRRLRGQS